MSDTKSKLGGRVMYAVNHRDSPSTISVLPTRGAFDLIRDLPGSPFVGNEFPVHVFTPTALRELLINTWTAAEDAINLDGLDPPIDSNNPRFKDHFTDYLKSLGMEGEGK